MPSLFHLAKHELHVAWRRFHLRRNSIPTGLGDSGWLLHGIVRSMKPKFCVEIGSAQGYSTCQIGLALKLNLKGRLWAVDPHLENAWSDPNTESSLVALRRNLHRTGVTDYVEIVRKRTADAVTDLPAVIDFAFIDGDHSYEGVKQDWEVLRPRMREFGVMVFHDTLWDHHVDDPYYRQWRNSGIGVPRFMEELREAGYPVVTIDQDWGLTLVQARVGGCSFRHEPATGSSATV